MCIPVSFHPLSSIDDDISVTYLPSGDIISTEVNVGKAGNSALYKTEMCTQWQEMGHCSFFGKCQYAHGENELRPILRHPTFKTTNCHQFKMTGKCKYGSRCRFRHAEPKTSTPKVHSNPITIKHERKYKTKLCKTWSIKQKCPYGPRCQFLHGYGDTLSLKTSRNTPKPEISFTTDISSINWKPSSPTPSASTMASDIDELFELNPTAKSFPPSSMLLSSAASLLT